MLYFFLSYARGDDDRFVQKFYRDLCAEVRVLTGSDGEVGFLDQHNIPLGSPWPEELTSALDKSQVFVALCSAGYFLSEPCGIEWSLFERRLKRYESTLEQRVPALIPLAWTRTTMHPVAANRQYDSDAFSEPYRREGLRQLIRLTSKRNAYLRFVTALAERIVSTAQQHEIPRHRTTDDFRSLSSAFKQPSGQAWGPGGRTNTRVLFVIAAGTRSQMRAVRQDVDFYGDNHEHWTPYRPSLDRPLCVFASESARRRRFAVGIDGIENLSERLRQASQRNEIVVLLVDPWVSRIERHRRALLDYDRRNEPVAAVMIPWSAEDQELEEHQADLENDVLEMLANNDIRRDAMFRFKIRTHSRFDEELDDVLAEAKSRLMRRGRVVRRPSQDGGERPILQGP